MGTRPVPVCSDRRVAWKIYADFPGKYSTFSGVDDIAYFGAPIAFLFPRQRQFSSYAERAS
jgi:hypothetical protein